MSTVNGAFNLGSMVVKQRLSYSGHTCGQNLEETLKEALYRIWCGANRLGDTGASRCAYSRR